MASVDRQWCLRRRRQRGWRSTPRGTSTCSGSNTKAILMVDPQGIVHISGRPVPEGTQRPVEAPDGSVVAMDELAVVGLSPQGIKTLVSFPTTDKVSYLGITGFSPNGIAVRARRHDVPRYLLRQRVCRQVRIDHDPCSRGRISLAVVGAAFAIATPSNFALIRSRSER